MFVFRLRTEINISIFGFFSQDELTLGHLHLSLSFLPPKIFPPLEHVAKQTLNPLVLIAQFMVRLASFEVGFSGVHPWHSESARFQKNPCFLFHLHLIRRLPMATLPASQICMQVAPSQLTLATPAGNGVNAGQLVQSAAARTPTG